MYMYLLRYMYILSVPVCVCERGREREREREREEISGEKIVALKAIRHHFARDSMERLHTKSAKFTTNHYGLTCPVVLVN